MPENNNQGGRGFANMSEEERRQAGSRGGKAAHESGNANKFDTESGREAGRRGGQNKSSGSESEQQM